MPASTASGDTDAAPGPESDAVEAAQAVVPSAAVTDNTPQSLSGHTTKPVFKPWVEIVGFLESFDAKGVCSHLTAFLLQMVLPL